MAPSLDRFLSGLGQGLTTFAGLQTQANERKRAQQQQEAEMQRQIQRDALAKMLAEAQVENLRASQANAAADNERADYEMGQRVRNAKLARGDAERKRITDKVLSRLPAEPKLQGLIQVSPGGRVFDPNTGKEVYHAPDRPKAATPPKPKAAPASIVNAKADNNATIRAIDEAMAAVRKNPNAVGPSVFNYLPETLKKPFNTAERTTVQAPIADVGSLIVKLRSGATVTVKEEPRLAPFIPDIRDKPEVVLLKLQRLRRKLEDINAELTGAYGGDGGQQSGPITDEERATLKAQGYTDEELDDL